MRARTVREQWLVLVAGLTAAMVLPTVGGGVAGGPPLDAAPRVGYEHNMRGAYSARDLEVGATTTARFLVPKFDATDCGPTDAVWADRRVYRDTQANEFYVQIWTACGGERVTAGGGWFDGEMHRLPELAPGERVKVTSQGSRHETRISVHNLDRGWVEEITSPSAPSRSGYAVFANNVWDGSSPLLEHTSFKRLKIDGRPFGEYETERFEGDCTRVSPLRRQGTSFHVTYVCSL